MFYKFLNINRRLMFNNSAWTARPLLLSLSSPRNTDQRTALRRRLDFWLVPRPSEFFILRNLPQLFQFEFQIFKIRLFVLSCFLKNSQKISKGCRWCWCPREARKRSFSRCQPRHHPGWEKEGSARRYRSRRRPHRDRPFPSYPLQTHGNSLLHRQRQISSR